MQCGVSHDRRASTRAHTDLFRIHFSNFAMHINLSLTPLVSLIAGILILIAPKLLNYIVAFYLIAVGVIGILGLQGMHLH